MAKGLRKLLAMYQRFVVEKPILSQAVQVGILMGAGDIISQMLVEKKQLKNFNSIRTLKFATIGFFMVGPTLRIWYGALNKYVGSKGTAVVIKKVLLDQLVFAPTFLFCLLIVIGFSHGKDWPLVRKDMENNYTDVVKTNWCLWPGVQLLNFYLIPLQYQVLIVQIVALFWNTYLAWKTNRQKEDIVK